VLIFEELIRYEEARTASGYNIPMTAIRQVWARDGNISLACDEFSDYSEIVVEKEEKKCGKVPISTRK
jgi:hypothetical protein